MATPSCSIVVTGFGPFADVEENPTDWLARELASGADGWRLPHGVPLRSAVLEVSTEDVDAQLQRLHSGDDSSGCVIYVHLGVDARGRGFALERTGVNNMTFRVADERGRQPTDEPIDAAPAARGVRGCRRSPLPLSSLRDALAARSAEEIRVSDDAGRYLCNYTLYESLRLSHAHNNSSGAQSTQSRHTALFVHVPPFEAVPRRRQLALLQHLLAELADEAHRGGGAAMLPACGGAVEELSEGEMLRAAAAAAARGGGVAGTAGSLGEDDEARLDQGRGEGGEGGAAAVGCAAVRRCGGVVPIGEAEEGTVAVGEVEGVEVRLWYRTWGSRAAGTPVLFVHGGPGNCVADYADINGEFFDAARFFVVEADQRGTGRSTPSVRESAAHMRIYGEIDISLMSADFEAVREALGLERWLVFGGSWGSTLALQYALDFPQRCLALILRGVFLSLPAEIDAVYSRAPYAAAAEAEGEEAGARRRLREFDAFAAAVGESGHDARSLLGEYDRRIRAGDAAATWHWHAFECNLMAECESERRDVDTAVADEYAEARSVAFFEARLFLRGAYEAPCRLLERLSGEAAAAMARMDTWVVQGTGDAVCPEEFARELVAQMRAIRDALEPSEDGVKGAGLLSTHFVDAGHKAGAAGIKEKLIECVHDYLDRAGGGS